MIVLLHTLVDMQHLQSDAFGQWIYIEVLIKVDTSGAVDAFMEHYTACILGCGKPERGQ